MFAIILGNCLHWIKQQPWTRVLIFPGLLLKLWAALAITEWMGCLFKECLPKRGAGGARGWINTDPPPCWAAYLSQALRAGGLGGSPVGSLTRLPGFPLPSQSQTRVPAVFVRETTHRRQGSPNSQTRVRAAWGLRAISCDLWFQQARPGDEFI